VVLCQIFKKKDAESDEVESDSAEFVRIPWTYIVADPTTGQLTQQTFAEERAVLSSLEPGALAQASVEQAKQPSHQNITPPF